MTNGVKSNVDVVNALYDATDVEVAIALMDPDCEWVESYVDGMPFVGTLHGTQAVRDEIYGRVSEFFVKFSLIPGEVFETNDEVVVATGRVSALTMSGKNLDAPFVHVFDMREGKIRRCYNYHDSGAWLAALHE